MRRLSAIVLLALLVSFLSPAGRASAATFRNLIAQVPATPTSQQSVRVWTQSDTAFGETAGIEYNVGSNYVKVLGTFDTGGPSPANWRADIPAQPNGTTVRYQLFTRNQSGQDYGFTGFNWSYTVFDGDVQAGSLKHDSFDSYYRSPFGAVTAGTSVTLRFRTIPLDVEGVTLRVYQYNPATDSTSGPVDYPMSYLEDRVENGANYAIWTYNLTTPATPAILYYKFKATDRLSSAWYNDDYADDHDNLNQGGTGVQAASESSRSFQITVYDPAFQTPAWLQNANVYQIFPDRFRNGDTTNDYCRAGGAAGCPTFYGNQTVIAHTTWNEAIYDPRVAGPYFNSYGTQFFGGDLKGIQDKLDYLQSLGIDTLYLTPIFTASSNHRYDTDDYLHVDPALGGDAAFTSLIAEMDRRGMHMILDGVFNHTSSDSVYFDRYHRYATDGACETTTSAYRGWYEFNDNNVPCTTGDYNGWFGYDSLAVLADASAAVRDYIYRAGADNVIKHWYVRGASGWRFDVADEITHNWWHDFRPYAKSYKADGPLVGEVWYDASQYLLGDQMDSVMNYRFRKNILGFARGGAQWNDNDNNGTNNIVALAPSQFDRAMKSIREDYPQPAQLAMLNLVDSHDTNRALYVLTLLGDSGLTQAKERLKLTALFQFTYLGAPMVYYGDEAGLNSPSLASGSNGPEDDPYNRAPYPWADEAGSQSVYGPADSGMIGYYSTLAHLRQQHPALRTGSFDTLLTGDTTASATDNNTYAFARVSGNDKAVVVLNNGAGGNTASIPVGAYFANGTTLRDALGGATYSVSGGSVTVTLSARGGAILLADSAGADTTSPSASASISPAPNANGYNNTAPVTVNLSGSDTGSGVKELRYWVDNGAVQVAAGNSASVSVGSDGATVSVRAVDNAGNVSPLTTVTVRIDTQAPDTTLASGPATPTNSATASFAFNSSETNSTFECKLDGAAYGSCDSPQSYSGLSDGSHTFVVRAVDIAGNADPTPASYSWTIDTAAPETTIGGKPANPTNSASASFAFSSGEAGSTFECSLDNAAFAPCSSPADYNGLAESGHTFKVRAIDAAGNADATPASYSWTIDITAPATTINSNPAALTNSATASFTFGSSEAGSAFECSLDGAAFAACTSPRSYSGLSDGSHTFAVRAKDSAGNVDPNPASYTWTIDTVEPDTTIDSAPSASTNSTSAHFVFSSGEAGTSFQCKLDNVSLAACVSPIDYSNLVDGSHTFTVVATDSAGNTDSTPASWTWTVDTTKPGTVFDSGPAPITNRTDATFTFHATKSGSTFACSLDGAAFASCSSPQSYTSLADGQHTFVARATDLLGNVEPNPQSYSWTVDTSAPNTSFTSEPAPLTNSASANFTFGSDESGSTFECKLDNQSFTSCTSPLSLNNLAEGQHTFQARATDAAGNSDPTPASYSWTIDVTAPITAMSGKPSNPTNITSASFTFTSSEPGSTFQCKLDAGAFAACASPVSYPNLAQGGHTFTVVATDAAGNTDSNPASFSWVIDTTPPVTSIGVHPAPLTNIRDTTFTFASSESGSFECSLDGADFAACDSPKSYGDLLDGAHTFAARAIDIAGNTDTSAASFAWTIDTAAPETTIANSPAALSSSSSASFAFGSSEAGSSFQCQLDGAAFVACESPIDYDNMADGSHTFTVVATDAAGNADPTPATWTWTIDTVKPITSIDSTPSILTNDVVATFAFHSTKTGSTFQCSLDGATFASCVSPKTYSGLADGSHTFAVRSTDPAGNTDTTPDSYGWTVDTVAPETTIASGPATLSNSASASFTFGSSETESAFQCKLDAGVYTTCSSPLALNNLTEGSHTFTVVATDAAGNTDATPASYGWTVDTIGPVVTIVSKPSNPTSSTSASFTLNSNETGSTFACSLDGAAYTACDAGASYSNLSDGLHAFAARATDAAGNAGQPAMYAWVVDTIAPDTSISSKPSASTNSTSASFGFTGADGNGSGVASFECKLDGGAFATCASGVSYSGLAIGGHSFQVRAIDKAGNVDASPDRYDWTVVQGYSFSGFFAPVNNLPIFNSAKAGSAIPVKFSLGGYFGLNIFAAGSPAWGAIACDSAAQVDPVDQTVTAGGSSLSYDSTTGWYTYVWKTDKSWANSCRQLVVKFSDGSVQRANFQFGK